ncbi:hypothetical protein NDU88_000929 [Pleurodeles waltl]|uniref:Uncharacterized protein n=1 Tax=Pleurodeles waltl TaxID=8319 RepID=A0AAV7WK02_PLEWA|nr:hypothetical protein NDU88_000929 [Pleurodeles waltl]
MVQGPAPLVGESTSSPWFPLRGGRAYGVVRLSDTSTLYTVDQRSPQYMAQALDVRDTPAIGSPIPLDVRGRIGCHGPGTKVSNPAAGPRATHAVRCCDAQPCVSPQWSPRRPRPVHDVLRSCATIPLHLRAAGRRGLLASLPASKPPKDQ